MVQGHSAGKWQTRIQAAEPMALPQGWLLQSWLGGMTLRAACAPHPPPQQVNPRQVGAKGSNRGHQLSYYPRCIMGIFVSQRSPSHSPDGQPGDTASSGFQWPGVPSRNGSKGMRAVGVQSQP